MSHLTHIKTQFQNLFYLEKALKRLNIVSKQKEQTICRSNLLSDNLLISQFNNCDIEFCWNGREYEIVTDLSFWHKNYPIEIFIDRLSQQYANEVIVGESHKIGFELVKYEQNSDGSNTLVLERWTNR